MIRWYTTKLILLTVLFILLIPVLVLILLKSNLGAIKKIQYGQRTATWKEVPGEVLTSKRYEQRNGRRVHTRYHIACRYEYKGKSYTTSNTGQGEDQSSLYNKTQTSRNLPVFVNPEQPSEAALSRGVKNILWLLIPLFSVMTLAPLGFIVVFLRKSVKELRRNFSCRPRDCQWGNFSTPEEVIKDLRLGNGQVAFIENKTDSKDLLYLTCKCEGVFHIIIDGNSDSSLQYISPAMNHKELLAFLKSYGQGISRIKFAKNWNTNKQILQAQTPPPALSS